jgi:hypothetical protein
MGGDCLSEGDGNLLIYVSNLSGRIGDIAPKEADGHGCPPSNNRGRIRACRDNASAG